MSSNYTSFAFQSQNIRQPQFSPNSAERPPGPPISESPGCANLLIDEDDSLTALCRHHNAQFCIIAGNAKTALYVHLRNVRCKEGVSEEDPSTWIPLSIAGYKYITLFARKMDDHTKKFTLHGYPVAPLEGGNVLFFFHPGVLDCISGVYEGEVEIEYHSGRIVTAIEWVKFLIVEDFSGHGAVEDHPNCDEDVDHLPEIPGIQQLPVNLEIPDPVQLPSDMLPGNGCCDGNGVPVPDPTLAGVNVGMKDVLQRHGVIK